MDKSEFEQDFIEAVGLSSMASSARSELLRGVRSELELRVGSILASRLSDEQLEEFESITCRDMRTIGDWLQDNHPDFVSSPLFSEFAASLSRDGDAENLLADYVAGLWLQKSCPDHKDVVMRVLEELKTEVREHSDALLAAAGGSGKDDRLPIAVEVERDAIGVEFRNGSENAESTDVGDDGTDRTDNLLP